MAARGRGGELAINGLAADPNLLVYQPPGGLLSIVILFIFVSPPFANLSHPVYALASSGSTSAKVSTLFAPATSL